MEISTGYTVGAYSLIVAVVASYVYLRVIKPNSRVRQPVARSLPAPVSEKAEPKKKKKPAKKDDKKEDKPKEAKAKETKPAETKTPEKAAESPKEVKDAKKDKKKKKNTPKEAPKEAARAAAPEVDLAGVADEDETPVDDHEFARQLSSLKEGTKFERRSAADVAANRAKSVKQSRAAKDAAFGAAAKDAEDSSPSASAEHTPDASPELAPADSTGVADMLEPTPAGPSVLRLVDTEEDKPKNAPKPKEVKETKKQRQNKRKNEELKAARAEAEVERKQLEEVQRRTARIAEGRPARDGSQFMAANPPAASAWSAGGAISSAATPSAMTPSSSYELLDTAGDAPKPAASRKIDDSWMSELPSEEEQIKMAKADAEWSTVKTKASKKTRKDESPAPAASSEAATPAAAAASLPTPEASFERPAPAKASGSFAALSAPEDEQEIEWDV
jgi:hypothetical protein